MANGNINKPPPDFGPEDGQMVDLVETLRAILSKRAARRLGALSPDAAFAELPGAITELLTNIQALDKSITTLTEAIHNLKPV